MHASISPLRRGNPLQHTSTVSVARGGIRSLEEQLLHTLAAGVAENRHDKLALLRPPPPLSQRHDALTDMVRQQVNGMKYTMRTSLIAALVNKATLAVKTVLGT